MRGLKARGHGITILSFEQGKNAAAEAQADLRQRLAAEGIAWTALYRLAKGLERWGFHRANHIVVLTHAAARILGDIPGVRLPLPPVTVIPTCVDLDRFRPAPDKPARRRELGLPMSKILVYQGS